MDVGLPEDVSLNGHLIDELLHQGHWVDLGLFTFMVLAMGLGLWLGRRHGLERISLRARLAFVAVVFVVIDGGMFLRSLRTADEVFWNVEPLRSRAEVVKVEVNAHQWSWDFRLAGDDGRFSSIASPSPDDLVRWNELTVPVGVPIWVQLTSTDVVHGFFLPNFRVKVDAVPGKVTQLWFEATRLGDFEIGCTQHCGIQHTRMRAVLHVVSADEFKRWQHQVGQVAELGFDADDTGARWGWSWQ